jgi:Zn-dependent metalloprotease
VSTRWGCLCCALPQRVIDHAARHALKHGAPPSTKLQADAHGRHADDVRGKRSARAAGGAPTGVAGASRRFIHDANNRKTSLPGDEVRREGEPKCGDDAADSAYENIGITLDFYRKVFRRKSLDGHGMDILASVHYGRKFPNAMWDGRQMRIGDGDGVRFGGFASALDLIAHELAHGVTQHAVPGGLGVRRNAKGELRLHGEAGALNESFSDVFASMVKQWHHKKQTVDRADWLIGTGIMAPEIGNAVRSLRNPGDRYQTYAADNQAADMSGFRPGADVHRNCGIPSRAFYLVAHRLGGRSWEHAGQIWYQTIPHLTGRSGFVDAANATTGTAARLFGTASKQHHAVQEAWHEVGVLRA